MSFDFKKFASSLRSTSGSRRQSDTYPPELLKTAADLHLKDGIPLKTIAAALVAYPEWQHLSLKALHVRLSRHLQKVQNKQPAKGSRSPRKKPQPAR